MKQIPNPVQFITAAIFLTLLLTWFFYAHESFPQPWRAITALLGTPVALASGLSYYLNIRIPVYETPVAVVLANAIAAVILVFILQQLYRRWEGRKK